MIATEADTPWEVGLKNRVISSKEYVLEIFHKGCPKKTPWSDEKHINIRINILSQTSFKLSFAKLWI